MRLININYRFLVFLYAYLRQIDLSLDRSRWGSWNNLKGYYKGQISVLSVINQLVKISKLGLDRAPIVFFVKEPSLLKVIKDFFLRLVMNKHYISDLEVYYCCQLLDQFNALLDNDFPSYPLEAEKLRADISKFYSYVLEPKMNKKDLNDAMMVEHFLQNDNITVLKMDVFAAGAIKNDS